ncbi:MAG: hypothetical protein CMQ29_16175 [Gammaproteobacteria bacterium]|nr:hypothetical protein [Gammaproteobacteria bacterium]
MTARVRSESYALKMRFRENTDGLMLLVVKRGHTLTRWIGQREGAPGYCVEVVGFGFDANDSAWIEYFRSYSS